MDLFFQVCQGNDFRLTIGEVHVMYLKGFKVADNDPAGRLVKGEIPGIASGLLIRRQQLTVGLLQSLFEADPSALLLDQHSRLRDVTVNKTGMCQLDREFKFHEFFRLFYAEYIPQ